MTATAPTFGQIRAQVAAVRKKVGDGARVFGIQTVGRWAGQAVQPFGGETYHIVQCDSPLAMRAALQDDAPEVTTRVLLTSLPMEQVAADILVRLARRKFYPINNWQIVKELFQARYIDPRIAETGWIAERLLELAPTSGYAPVPSGVLDAETVWGILLQRQISLAVTSPDLVALLKWSMDENNIRQYRESPEPFRVAARAWIGQSAGPAGEAVLACVRANDRPDALPVGLAMAVVFSEEAAGKLDKAAGRIEKYLGHAELNEQIAHQWHTAATEVARLHLPDAKIRSAWLQRADEILEAVQADEYAYLSRTSPGGFDQRLGRYGRALAAALDANVSEVPERVNEAFRGVSKHDEAKRERGSRRLQRVEMSARLLRWLAGRHTAGETEAGSLAEAAWEHALAGGFVDWAQYTLRAGDRVRELADAYTLLNSKVVKIKEQQNRRFSGLLRDWTAAGSTRDELMPVERVLEDLVAPLAVHAPVLVLVIDGMSFAVFRELIEYITRQDWVEIRRDDRGTILPAIATLPSVTEVCRTSLLCGKLRSGHSGDEKSGFAGHPSLVTQCRSGVPPVLFHKDALQLSGDGGLAAAVIKEIESTRRRIVGVVINAVDDHLLKGDQLDIRWTGEEIKVLPTLLYEAKAAGRLVVTVSDHGHILDQKTQQRKHEGGDRWRADDGNPAGDEVQISGQRVILPSNHRLIAPWSEKVRYSMKKNGYHGGVTMQEMVIPLAVLSARDDLPEGWAEPPADTPDWWFTPLEENTPVEETVVEPVKPARRIPAGLLFNLEGEEPEAAAAEPTAAASTPSAAPAWIDRLLQSPILSEQKKLGGRTVPSDAVFRGLLEALGEQGDKMTSAALAHKMQWPPFRLRGLLAAIQRVLNVEGYAILTRDEASDTVELNRPLLCRQFEIS